MEFTLSSDIDEVRVRGREVGAEEVLPREWIYRYPRQARLVDGASEVHKMALSKNLMELGPEFWSWG